MAKNDNGAIAIAPGINLTASEYEASGRWIDCDKVRFFQGKPEKIGGWEIWTLGTDTPLPTVCRSIFCWFDYNYNAWHAFGTVDRLWVYNQEKARYNVTPFVSTGTIANPFTTTAGSPIVAVAHTGHALAVSQYVNYSGAAAVGGITIDGEYQITTIVDANNYTITHTSNAASSAGPGGGASVAFSYELAAGFKDFYEGGGWGLGTWGTSTWGTARPSSTYLQFPRYWSLDKYGRYLTAMPSGGGLFMWQLGTGTRAAVIANAPATGLYHFITSERMIVVLGSDGDFMQMAWCSDNDETDWTPSAINTANVRKLQDGSRLVAGSRLSEQVNMIWSDTSCILMQYIGSTEIYSTRTVGNNCGLSGPGAFVVVQGQPFWMSNYNFYTYTGSVTQIPNNNEINAILDSTSEMQRIKTTCHYNSKFHEVWWVYPSTNADEPDRYVAVSLNDWSWTVGAIDRTAFAEKNVNGITTLFGIDSSGNIYEHEVGTDAAGEAMAWYIESGYFDLSDGNSGINVNGYIPDFKRQTGTIDIMFTSKDYPDEPDATATLDTSTETIDEGQGIVDLYHFGRQSKFRLYQEEIGGDFRLGNHRIEATPSGARR